MYGPPDYVGYSYEIPPQFPFRSQPIDSELKLPHLSPIKQKDNEHVVEYISRIQNTRNRCFNLNISNKDLACLGLSPHLK
jgi:hypothetical protein